MFRSLVRIVLVLGVLAPVARADILTVGPARSGARFTQIQAAVDAAVEDDVILVRPGSYAWFVVEKPLRILGDGTGIVSVSGYPWAAVVRFIAAGEEVVLSGLALSSTGLAAVLVRDSGGTVVLHDLDCSLVDKTDLYVYNSGPVVLADSRMLGGVRGGTPAVGGSIQGGAIEVVASELWITDSVIRGGDGDPGLTLQGAHGIYVWKSTLRVWSTSILGGDGSVDPGTGPSGLGGTGIIAFDSNLDFLGGPGAEIRGGRGAHDALLGASYPGGPGIHLARHTGARRGSTARSQAALPVHGGLDGLDLVQAPNVRVDSPSSFTLTSQVFPTLASAAPQAALGSFVPLTLAGTPGALQVLYLSLRTGPRTILRGVEGFGWLDPANLYLLRGAILPASGSLVLDLPIPPRAALLGSTAYLQTTERFAGRHSIGAPALVTITR